jgi:hypothetical protein
MSASDVFTYAGLKNMGGVAIILKNHISNVSISNLGSFMADFDYHFLNPP